MALQTLQPVSNITSTPANTGGAQNNQQKEEAFWGNDGFTFGDLVDMFNPMHHMPVISKYYREQTHDDASEGSRLVGGLLFGGLMGGVAGIVTSIANSAVRHETHHDMSEHLIDMTEESLAKAHFSPDNDFVKSLKNNTVDSNPFFLQALEDNSNYGGTNSVAVQRKRDWGSV